MKLLFENFVRVFETDRRWLLRMLAAGGYGLLIAIAAVWQGQAKFDPAAMISVLIALPALFVLAGLFLATKDVVRQRLQKGESVGRLSRLLFGRGAWSLILWIVIVLTLGFPLAIFLGSIGR